MDILICGPVPSDKGGVTVWMRQILEYTQNHPRNDIHITHLPVKRSVSLTHLLPPHKRIYYSVKDYLSVLHDLRRVLKEKHFDVIHIVSSGRTGIIRDYLFSLTAKKYHVRPIIHFHCGTIPETMSNANWLRVLLVKAISMAYKIVVLDESSKQCLENAGFQNIVKIGNAYNATLDSHTSKNQRKQGQILFVGHVVDEKGIRELLEATRDIPDISLRIIGPQNEKKMRKYTSLILSQPRQSEVLFLGSQPQKVIYNEMREASLFILPTYSEGFPFVIVEAMACGCPIISTPVGAIEEMLSHNGELCGFLIPPRSATELRKQIINCLKDPIACARKSKLAQQKAYLEYSEQAIMSKLYSLWEPPLTHRKVSHMTHCKNIDKRYIYRNTKFF